MNQQCDIVVKYFASLKEKLGRSEDYFTLTRSMTVSDVWAHVNPEIAPPEQLKVAVNLDYVSWDWVVKPGDEVAFFPPVTGG
ncbi:MAG: MoaD/ThiS family protein [Methylovulum sp.]|jgi:molybdopterin synthase sulfur carrier subunit|nr:MoaD/ThiS family protein [Methylovulum sp.]